MEKVTNAELEQHLMACRIKWEAAQEILAELRGMLLAIAPPKSRWAMPGQWERQMEKHQGRVRKAIRALEAAITALEKATPGLDGVLPPGKVRDREYEEASNKVLE